MKKRYRFLSLVMALSMSLSPIAGVGVSYATSNPEPNASTDATNTNVNTDSKIYYKIIESNTDNGIAYNDAHSGVKYANIQFRDYDPKTNEINLMMTFHYQGGNWSHDNRTPDSGTINLTFRNPSFTEKIESISFPNNTRNNVKNFEEIPYSNKASWRFLIQNLNGYGFSGNTLYSMPIKIKLNSTPTESDRNTILEMVWINRDSKYDPFSTSNTIFQNRQSSDTVDLSSLWISSDQPVSGRVVVDTKNNVIKTVHALKPVNSLTDNNFKNQRDNLFYDSNIYLSDKLPSDLTPYLDKTVLVYRSTYDGSMYNTKNGYTMTLQDNGLVSTKSNPTIGISADINQAREALAKDEGSINDSNRTRGPLFARGQNSIEYTFEYKLAPGKSMEDFLLALGKLSEDGKAEIYSWQEYQKKGESPNEIKYSRHMSAFTTSDGDQDGLIDDLEKAIGTSIFKEDTDGDGKSDYTEYILDHTDPTNAREFKVKNPTIIQPEASTLVIPSDKSTDFIIDVQTIDYYKGVDKKGERIPVTSSTQAMYNFFRITKYDDIKAILNGDESANALRLGTKSQQDKIIPLEALNNPNSLRFSFNPKDYGLKDGERFVIAFKPMDRRTLRSITEPIYVGSFGILDGNGGNYGNNAPTSQVRLTNENGRYKFNLEELNKGKLPIPKREGYRFLGYANKKDATANEIVNAQVLKYADQWNDDKVYRIDETSPLKEASQTVYAIWEKEGYVINFHDNEGKVTSRYNVTDIQTIGDRKYIKLPRKSNFDNITGEGQFRGWADKPNETNPLITGSESLVGMSRPLYLYDGASFDVTNLDIDKTYDLYAIYEPYIDIKAQKIWANNNNEKPEYYVGLVRAEAIGSNDNPALNPDITYISNGTYIGFTYVPGSEKVGADNISWENLPAYSPAGRRYSYVILESEKQGEIPKFNADWSTANVTIIKTDGGRYNKSQALSLKNKDNQIDAYSGATQRNMEYTGGTQANPDTITGYNFKITNTKEELNRPTIYNIYNGDKEFYFDPKDGSGKLDRIEIKVKEDTIHLSKDASGSWSLDNNNYLFSRLDEEGKTDPQGRYFTIALKSGEFATGDKVEVTNSLSTSTAKRTTTATAVDRPNTLKLEKPSQRQNENGKVLIATKIPKGTPENTIYTIEKKNPDGTYTQLAIEAKITPDELGDKKLEFIIPIGEYVNEAKTGDVFRIKAETDRFNPNYTDETDPIDADKPIIKDQSFRFYQYETDKSRLAINLEGNSNKKIIKVVAQNPVDGVNIEDKALVLSDDILNTEKTIELNVKAIDQYNNQSDEATLTIDIKRREQAKTPEITQQRVEQPSYEDGFVKINIKGEANEQVQFIYNNADNYIVNLDKDGNYIGYIPKELIPESGEVKAIGKSKDKRDSEEHTYYIDKTNPEAVETTDYIAGTGYIDIKVPTDETLREIWIRDDVNSFTKKIVKSDDTFKIDDETLQTVDGKLRIPVDKTELRSVGKLTFTSLDKFNNAVDIVVNIKINIAELEKSLAEAKKLKESNPPTEADKKLEEAKKIAEQIIHSVKENLYPQPTQDQIDKAKKDLDDALNSKYKELLEDEIKKASTILNDNEGNLVESYKEKLTDVKEVGQDVLSGKNTSKTLKEAYENLKNLNDNVQVLAGKVIIEPKPKDGDTNIQGTTTPGATILISLPSGNIVTARADGEGKFKAHTRELKVNDKIDIEVREENKTPRKATIIVETNKENLKDAIREGEGLIPEEAPANENTQDSNLRKAIQAGKEIIEKANASQEEINQAEEKIKEAIKAKEALDKSDTQRKALVDDLKKEIDRASQILEGENKDSLDATYKDNLEKAKGKAEEDLTYLNDNSELADEIIREIQSDTANLKILNDNPVYTSGAITVNPALKNGDTQVRGTAPADSVVTVILANGKKIRTFADDEGNFIVNIKVPGLVAGEKVTITSEEAGKKERSEEFTVAIDTDKLNQAIKDASKLIADEAPTNESPQDKKLREAIGTGKKVKETEQASQKNIDEAEKAIRDAIKLKEEADNSDSTKSRLSSALEEEIIRAKKILDGDDRDSLNSDYKKELEEKLAKAKDDLSYIQNNPSLEPEKIQEIEEDTNNLKDLNDKPIYNTGAIIINPQVKNGDTEVHGTAPKNSTISITLPNGSTITTTADTNGNFTVNLPQPALKAGEELTIKAQEGNKKPSEIKVTVAKNTSNLEDAIRIGKEKLPKDENEYKDLDKKLKEAIKEGEIVKNDKASTQEQINNAEKAIRDALSEKEATSEQKAIEFKPSDKDNPANPVDQNIPSTDNQGHRINYIDYYVIGFNTDGNGTINDNEAISFLVKKGTRFEDLDLNYGANADYDFWKWEKANTSNLTGTIPDGFTDKALFITSSQEIKKDDQVPVGYHVVYVNRYTSIKDDKLFGKRYAVKDGFKLDSSRLPKLASEEDYKDPKWYLAVRDNLVEIEDPTSVSVTSDMSFLARASYGAKYDKEMNVVYKTAPRSRTDKITMSFTKPVSKVYIKLNDEAEKEYDVDLSADEDMDFLLDRRLVRGDKIVIKTYSEQTGQYSYDFNYRVLR